MHQLGTSTKICSNFCVQCLLCYSLWVFLIFYKFCFIFISASWYATLSFTFSWYFFLYFSYFIFMWCCFLFIILAYDISSFVMLQFGSVLVNSADTYHLIKTQFISTWNSWANSSWYEYQLLLRFFFLTRANFSYIFLYFHISVFYLSPIYNVPHPIYV